MGTQGWSYDDWVGPFYPPGTRSTDWLTLYSRAFDTVEVDSTFYGRPPPGRFESWRARTPDGFVFTVKMPGEVTHETRLQDPRPALRFCEDVRGLGEKLGMVLIQLPPDFGPKHFSAAARFLQSLPRDLGFAVEFRDRDWLVPDTVAMLEATGTALALSTGPWLSEPAARALAGAAPGDSLYVRWMGSPRHQRDPSAIVAGRDREIDEWAGVIADLDMDTVYAFFNNDYQGHGPASARRLQSRLGHRPVPPGELSPQGELFQ